MQEGDDIPEVQASNDDETPTKDDMDLFFKNLKLCGTKPALLSLIPEYLDNYIPKTSFTNFPQPLTSLQKPEYLKLPYHDLLNVCGKVFVEVTITDDMAKAVESETRQQHKTNLWFKYRAGRVTASRMKAVCHTDITNPSQSLVKSVCYPEAFTFISKQTNWGCKHEKQAREHYRNKSNHANLVIAEMDYSLILYGHLLGHLQTKFLIVSAVLQVYLKLNVPTAIVMKAFIHLQLTIRTLA